MGIRWALYMIVTHKSWEFFKVQKEISEEMKVLCSSAHHKHMTERRKGRGRKEEPEGACLCGEAKGPAVEASKDLSPEPNLVD